MLTRSDVIAAEPKALEETVRAIVKIDDYVGGDKQAWIDVINKVTGLDKSVAADAIGNLYPDPKMYRASAIAIAAIIRDLKYINSHFPPSAANTLTFRFPHAPTAN